MSGNIDLSFIALLYKFAKSYLRDYISNFAILFICAHMNFLITKKDLHSPFLKYCILVVISLITFLEVGFSQNPGIKFKNISREQGLSNSTIQCIYQDFEGFMWFGTADGLNRYDGYKTIVYQNNPIDSKSIKDNFITCILEDKNKTIWVSSGTGLNRFNRDLNNFTRFSNQPKNPASISNNIVHCIYKDLRGNLWLGTLDGLNLLGKNGSSFIRYSNLKNGVNGNNIICIFEDRKGNLWIGTDGGGLFQFNREICQFKAVPIQKNNDIISNNSITAITEDASGNLLIGTKGGGLVALNMEQHSFINYRHNESNPSSLSGDVVKSLLSTPKNGIWVGIENGGLNRLNPVNGSFSHYENNLDNPTSLSQKTPSAIYEDNQGNIWVGTHRGGVNLYCPAPNKFDFYTQGRNSLSFKDVKAFFEDKQGLLWIGTDGGGINIWNRKTGFFQSYRHQKGNASSIGSDAILNIMQDKKGNIWVGTWGGGLNLYTGNGQFKKFLNNPAKTFSISSNNVWHIFEDSRSNLWIATSYGGLNLFDRKTERFTRITTDSHKKTSFLGNNVVSINEDKKRNLWFSTSDGGLNCLDINTGQFKHYFFQNKDVLEGGVGNLRVIFIDHKQRLWVGRKGLYLFDYNKNSFSLYTNNPTLSNEQIQGITEDKNGILWISTSNGLFSFKPETKALRQYTSADGLQGLEFNQNACIRLASGEMLFGGFNGFNIFNPINIPKVKNASPVYITDLQIFNKSVEYGQTGSPLKSPVGQAKEIRLQYNQSVFSLEYSALDYISPEETQYAYKLEGFDKNWNYVGTQRKATFTNLDPGVYTFHVKAATNAGVWNNKDTFVKIIILPPYWMTWWFRMLATLLLLSIAYSMFFYHRKFESKRLDEQKAREIQQMQLQFFTNISHEFRTPLSLIAGPLELIQKEEGILPRHLHYLQMMQRNVNRLLGLISELMDFRKVEEGVLTLKVMPGNLGIFVKELAGDFANMALQKNIRFNVNLPEPLTDVWFDHQVVEKIIINLIYNSFKYTADGGTITIGVLASMQNFVSPYENELVIKSNYQAIRQVYIRITDTGKGISKESIRYLFDRYYRITQEHLGSGVGLAFVKSLTRLHKGSINVYSQLHKGTEIIIALPCTKEDYTNEEKWIGHTVDGEVQLESIRYKSIYQEPLPHSFTRNIEATPVIKHILIVDDNEELRIFLKESLGSIYSISEAENGSDGLEKARAETPDLIISDVMMPVMDGIEFCRQLKGDIEISHIPFIMLTAKDALQAKMDGLGGGADYYFSKPISLALLMLTIRNMFDQRQKIKERYSSDYNVEVRELVHSAKDKDFINNLIELMELQIENTDLNVDYICQQIGMSRTKLYKKIKDLTGQTINEFVRVFRLKKAVEIMTNEDIPIMEVMYRIGIQSHSHFTTSFKKEFGKTPSQFMQEIEVNRKAKDLKKI